MTDTSLSVACIQMRSSRSMEENLATLKSMVADAAQAGAHYVQTPEMTNILERSRDALFEKIALEENDTFLAESRQLAAEHKIYLHLGSLAVLREDGKVANRAFVITPSGEIAARYDKIHMFDVDLANGESWRESRTYEPGTQTVLVDVSGAQLGLSICYDVRFPALYREQSKAGAQVLTVPAAFTKQTGEAHWEVLMRARAIENGAFVIATGQGGLHEDGRETYGHSVIVDPWGRILARRESDEPGILHAKIDLEEVNNARAKIPNLQHERPFDIQTVAQRDVLGTAG